MRTSHSYTYVFKCSFVRLTGQIQILVDDSISSVERNECNALIFVTFPTKKIRWEREESVSFHIVLSEPPAAVVIFTVFSSLVSSRVAQDLQHSRVIALSVTSQQP